MFGVFHRTAFRLPSRIEVRSLSGWEQALEWAQVTLEPAQGAKFGTDGLFPKSEEQEVPNIPLCKRSVAMLRNHARGDGLCIPPRGRIAVAERSPRPATCARSDAAQDAFRLRATFVTAYVRYSIGRIRSGRLHDHATDGVFDGNGFSAVRSSVTGGA